MRPRLFPSPSTIRFCATSMCVTWRCRMLGGWGFRPGGAPSGWLPAWGRPVAIDSKTNAPLLIVGEQNGRRLGVLAFDLRRSDLPLRVAFPILIANLVDALVPGGGPGPPATAG